ncbi:hypothetical protein AgCh_000526 [Apium graveolens]
MKVVVSVAAEPQKMIDKDRKDYTPKDISSIMKDAKVRHILNNSLDSVMSNRVIGCKTTKEIWDALEVKCQGTTVIKKNRRTVLTQEYEHFDSRDNESLFKIYERFQKLLNDLSLVNKEYDLEDSNLKFLLALPENWDFKVTSIRDNYQLYITPLDEIYGVLKTYELEMEQRSKRKGSKPRPVALKVEEKPKEKARRKSYSKGEAMIFKSDTELSNSVDDSNPDTKSDTDSDHNNNEDMDQIFALLVKSFKKMIYSNFKKGRRFSRKGSSSSNSDKRNNKRDTDWKEARFGKTDKSKERCYNCDGLGHFAADCRKPRAEKKQVLISKKRNRDISSDSDDGINCALMANVDAETNTAVKVPQSTLVFDTDDICELRLFLKTLHGDRRNALVLDSGCSGHMTGYKSLLSEFEEKASPSVSYGNGNLGKILGYGKIKVKNVIIENEHCEIVSKSDRKITLTSVRHGRLYEARVSTRTDNSEVRLLPRKDDHDKLRFENKVPYAELLNPDSDTISPDITQSSEVPQNNGNSSNTEAYVEEEQHDSNPETTASDTTQGISVERSSDSSSSNSDESNTDNYGNTDSGGASGNNSGTTQRNNREFMDQGGCSSSRSQLPSAIKWSNSHTPELMIRNPDSGVRTRKATQNECLYHSFLSQTEPKKVEEALQDVDWVITMQEELNEFERNKV